MRFLNKFFSWRVLLIILIVTIAYGQTIFMYFWQDDSALIFKLQHQAEAMGSFGAGIWERGAYQYLVVPFVPFFTLFGKEPLGYFFIGFLTYIFATFSFWLFSKSLMKNKNAAFFTSLVFAAGYIGSDTMFRVINSWQTNIGITLAMITLWAFTKFLHSKNYKFYLLSVIFYLVTIELVFIRSHSLIFAIVALDVLFNIIPFKIKNILKIGLRQIPFLILFKIWFLQDANFGGKGISSVVMQVISGHIEVLIPLFANIGNVLIPTTIQSNFYSWLTKSFLSSFGITSQIYILHLVLFILITLATYLIARKNTFLKEKLGLVFLLGLALIYNLYVYSLKPLWYQDVLSIMSGFLGLTFSVLIIFLGLKLWRKNKLFSITIIFGLSIIISQIFGYYSQYPTAILPSTHRYFSYSFIGYSLVIGTGCFFIFQNIKQKNILKLIPFVILLAINLILGVRYQQRLLVERSIPSRNFYQDLLALAPSIEKGSLFYFDVVNDPFYQRQFGDFFSVGSMPETTALAMYYNLDRYDMIMTDDLGEVMYLLDSGKIKLYNVHSFFYDKNGLTSTTNTLKDNFSVKSRVASLDLNSLENIQETTSLSDALLSIDVIASLPRPSSFPFDHLKTTLPNFSLDEKKGMITFLKNQKEYYSEASVVSTSEWKFRETLQINDNDINTVWQGHRIWWHDHNNEEITIDLSKKKAVSRVVWQNWQANLSPMSYSLQSSLDGKTWSNLKNVELVKPFSNGEVVSDSFTPIETRFIKMVITKTATDDSPAILEIMALGPQSDGINPVVANQFLQNPFSRVETLEEWLLLEKELGTLGLLSITWKTDKQDVYNNEVQLPLIVSKVKQSYKAYLPLRGSKLQSLSIKSNVPANITLENATLKYLSIDEIKTLGKIREYNEN